MPFHLTALVGRQHELAELSRLLSAPGNRLVTLVGLGGIGKTRLALQVAAALAENSAGAAGPGVVELAGVPDPELVPHAVACALRVPDVSDEAPAEQVAAHLGSRGRLLVLDNCEHVLDACAELAYLLLARCPGLTILATSREPLHVAGELVWPVPPLSLPSPAGEGAAGSEAVQLFVACARRALPSWTPGGELATVGQICRRLDGLPLAIELAAAWIRVLSAGQILERLEDRFRLLATADRGVPARHQTLEAMLDWSYGLLPPDERRLFRRLAAFAGSLSLDAAGQVCGEAGEAGPPLLGLSGLADRSLLAVERIASGPARYRLLETVHAYAARRLRESGEEEAIRDRHLAWALALAEQARPQLWGAGDAASLARLDQERENLWAALAWAADARRAAEGTRLAVALGWYWYVRARPAEGRAWLARMLAINEGAPRLNRAYALNTKGALAVLQGDYDGAAKLLLEAIELDCEQECSALSAWCLHHLGLVALFNGSYRLAEQTFDESRTRFRALGEAAGIASLLLYQGLAAYYGGDPDRAAALLAESVPALRELGDGVALSRALSGLGLVARRRREPGQARALFGEALALAHEKGAWLEVAHALDGLAGIAAETAASGSGAGERAPGQAAALFGAAERLRREAGTDLPAGIRGERDRDVETARRRLGADRFAAARAAGLDMTLEQALAAAAAVARPDDSALPAASVGQARPHGGLSERERQVAVLIAQGRSNRQIAADLVLTVRTVETHVTHILGKLGFSSRAQIAAWAVSQGLVGAPPEPPAGPWGRAPRA